MALSCPGPTGVDQASSFLIERFGESVLAVSPLGHGEWSTAFAFQIDDAAYIVRFGAHRDDFAKDQRVAQYRSPSLPIPAVIEIGEAFGGHYAISERLHGDEIDELDAPAMRALLPSLFATFDAIRAIDHSDSTGFGMWGADGNAPFPTWRDALLDVATDKPRLLGWRDRLATSPTGAGPFDEAFATLEALTAIDSNERHLIHSDMLHFNVLVSGEQLTAVFDWGNALYGDFLYDIAWFAMWAPWYPAWEGIDFVEEAKRHFQAIGLDVPRLSERLRACMIHIGLDNQAYSAFAGNWEQLDQVAKRTLAIAQSAI
ncbi:MAG: aminoglycoside phosphotransferase family protein [Thermomicrobiales bacterium]|nr:aminoglycoside phosphotransferase family protein [Thermomicrobiales bacterium]